MITFIPYLSAGHFILAAQLNTSALGHSLPRHQITAELSFLCLQTDHPDSDDALHPAQALRFSPRPAIAGAPLAD
jgi:hypothetical protein